MVNNRKQRIMLLGEIPSEDGYANLKPSDKAVWRYLDELTLNNEGKTCTASIPKIGSTCGISQRQVQISTRRLINAGLLERIGYDFSNPDRKKRGTIYKVLISASRAKQSRKRVNKKSIKFILFWSED
jgi:hypothetical protein